ncbi:MAG TPA: alpha/beta hydrolase [Allosphingosinicella sp.]|nr:alpha/beta hydrolase [Allosphingosinicella sp.]
MRATLFFLTLLAASPLEAQAVRMAGDLPRKDARPLQALAGVETEYGSVRTSEGHRLRTILTRPAGAARPLPALFLAQWVSCGSLDVPADKPGLLQDIARQSGMVFIRVERAGTGDSEGPLCRDLDFETEVRHYREALDQLSRHPWIDSARLVIFGSSLGSVTAPLIAEGRRVAGVVVQGGGAVTYLERMINFDRLYLERSGKYRPEQFHDEMLRRIRFHTAYLLDRKVPAQVALEQPDLATVWAGVRGGAEAPPHYGRPYAWHWQAAATNFAAAWARLEAPVLVFHGEYDQFEPRHGHELIALTVSRLRPGTATFIEIPKADHELEFYASADEAYRYENPTVRRDIFLKRMFEWIRGVALKGAPAAGR